MFCVKVMTNRVKTLIRRESTLKRRRLWLSGLKLSVVCIAFVSQCDTIEKNTEEVIALAQRYLDNGSVSSFDSLFREFIDGEGHTAIHFAASRNALDTAKWILEKDPGCVFSISIG